MMSSSVGSTRGNPRGGGGREKSAKTNQATHQSKTSGGGGSSDHSAHVGKKATADQMRMAQIYSDGTNDETTKEKIRQVQDVVPKSEDEVLVALHDSNYDTEKAIMLLLERGEGDQQGEWETISSKKSKHRGGVSSGFRNNSDIINDSKNSNGPEKDGRDRRDNRGNKDRDGGGGREKSDGFKDGGFGTFGSGGREGKDGEQGRERGGFGSRGRGRNNRGQLPPRMTRGRGQSDSNSREREKNERNRWDGGESGRGRGRRGHDNMNGPSRRGRGPRSFTNSKFGGNFEDDAFKPGDNVWTNPPAETESNTWDNSMVKEDWGAEDWSGDDAALNGGRTEGLPSSGGVGQPNWMTALTESKVFMASSTPPTTAPITLDSIESSPMPPLSSSLNNAPVVSMSPGSNLSSNVSLAPSMPPQSSMPEMTHGRINLAELFAKPSTQPVNSQPLGVPGGLGSNGIGGLGVSVGGLGTSGLGSAGTIGTGSSGLGGSMGSAIGSGPAGMGSSSIADLSQRQTSTSVFSAYVDLKPPVSESKLVGQQLGVSEPPSATVPAAQLSVNQQPAQQQRVLQQQQPPQQQQQTQQQQQQAAKPSKKRLPPPSTKIPASAVEMPGGPVPARGLGVLDVQFGAMDLNMEPSLPDFEVGSISSNSVGGGPSTSLAAAVTVSLTDGYSGSEPTAAASHLSYTTKVSDTQYPTQTINSALMSNSTTSATTIPTGLDRSVYAPGAQTRQMTPDPIPMPTQDLKGSPYMQQQQQQQTQQPPQPSIETKSDKQQLQQQQPQLSNLPSHSTAMSSLTSHPSSLASSMALSSGGGLPSSGLHSQMGLSSHAPSHQSQSLGSSRQIPNSYHGSTSSSITPSGHTGSINVGYGSSSQTAAVTHPSSAYSSVHSNLGGAGTHSSAGLPSSSLTASGLPSGPSSILSTGNGLSSGVQSGGLPAQLSGAGQLSGNSQLSGGSQLPGGPQLSSGSQLSNSAHLSSGTPLSSGGVQLSNSSSSQLASGNVQLSNSGHHPPNSLTGGLNSSGGLNATTGVLNSATHSSNNTHSTHTSVQTSPLTQGKLGGSGLDNRIHQGSSQHVLDHSSHQSSLGPSTLTNNLGSSSHPVSTTSYGSSTSGLGFTSATNANTSSTASTTTTASTGIRATTIASNSKLPNLPPGMSFVPNQLNQQYIMGHGVPLVNAFAPHHQQFYNYEEFQMQLSRMPGAAAMGYGYDLQQFQQPTTTLPGARDVSSLSTSPYSVTENKFTRGDASSPVGASSLSAQQPSQQPGQQHATGSHHAQPAQQQPALFNAAAAANIPPGYGYAGGLPYYQAGHAGILPPGLQYPPPAGAVFPAVSTVQPTNRSQPATTLHSGFQQSAYGSHGAYGTGYDDLTQTQDFTKSGYSAVSQTQKTNTGATAGRSSVAAGTSAAAASVGAADISGQSAYSTKTHTPSFPDKQSFHGTPPPFSFPLASGNQAGPLNPAANAYPQHPFVPMLPHHNAAAAAAAILPQQLHGGDSHVGSTQRGSQGTSGPAKQTTKQSYGSTYWSAT